MFIRVSAALPNISKNCLKYGHPFKLKSTISDSPGLHFGTNSSSALPYLIDLAVDAIILSVTIYVDGITVCCVTEFLICGNSLNLNLNQLMEWDRVRFGDFNP